MRKLVIFRFTIKWIFDFAIVQDEGGVKILFTIIGVGLDKDLKEYY